MALLSVHLLYVSLTSNCAHTFQLWVASLSSFTCVAPQGFSFCLLTGQILWNHLEKNVKSLVFGPTWSGKI